MCCCVVCLVCIDLGVVFLYFLVCSMDIVVVVWCCVGVLCWCVLFFVVCCVGVVVLL